MPLRGKETLKEFQLCLEESDFGTVTKIQIFIPLPYVFCFINTNTQTTMLPEK